MTRRHFFLLESRRLLLSLVFGFCGLLLTGDWILSALFVATSLVVSWGWQLARFYRWLENPEELPPTGGADMRNLLHDVYVLRSRQAQSVPSAQRSQPYLKESLASMRDAALIINAEGRLVWCNDAAEYLLDVRFDDEEGQLLADIVPGKPLKKYLRERNFQKPLRVKPGPDPEFCLQFEFSRFGVDDRLVFIKDVTEQDKLERMRRDFVGNVSHELRTPLTVIKGYIETLQSLLSDADARLQNSLGSMSTQAARMESLINDLLWLSRIESVEGQRKDDQIDMAELLTDLCGELAAAWSDRAIDLQSSSSLSILGDAAELRSAVSNLIVNALKYSEASVTVRWTDTVVGPALLVEDQGQGIEAKHIPRLTERFYRVDKSRSQATGGTGLGLAIVKHVAVSHDAKLFVDSQVGRGSTFRLVFPADRAVCATDRSQGVSSG